MSAPLNSQTPNNSSKVIPFITIRFPKYPIPHFLPSMYLKHYMETTIPIVNVEKPIDPYELPEFVSELFAILFPKHKEKLDELLDELDHEIKGISRRYSEYAGIEVNYQIYTRAEKLLTRNEIELIIELANKYGIPLKPYVAYLYTKITSLEQFYQLRKQASKKSWVKVLSQL